MQEANAVVTRQVVDPAVSQQKFEQELNTFCNNMDYQRGRGVILLDAQFPDIILAFAAPHLRPAPIVFAVRINYENYDLEPLSLTFVDPFSYAPVSIQQMNTRFISRLIIDQGRLVPQELLQAESNGVPFLCLPGVREYHNHPAHTGDPWLLHKGLGGEGTLGFLVDKLYEYGITTLSGFHVEAQVNKLNLGVNIKIN